MLLATLLLFTTAGIQEPPAAPPPSPPDIEFIATLDLARLRATEEPRPIVLVFGARWCGWCRKLEYETLTDEAVAKKGAGFHWVKIDLDSNRELAASYGVHGLPHTAVIGADGERRLGSRSGFLNVTQMLAFLDMALVEDGKPIEGDGEPKRPPTIEETTRTIVLALSRPERAGREQQLKALEMLDDSAWRVLVTLLEHERLSIRAAAAGALLHCAGPAATFDPFEKPEKQATQVEAWRQWVEKNATPLPPEPEPETETAASDPP
jgi:thioredoxin-like negative regulator of GroEL